MIRAIEMCRMHSNKLGPHFYGAFKIIKHARPVAYELELPLQIKIHNVYVSLLGKFTETPPFASFVLPPILNGQVIRSRLNRDNLENRLRMHVREFSDNQV